MDAAGSRTRVRFDFDGSLVLARQLWALGEHLDGMRKSRQSEEDLAGHHWRGKYADDFHTRMTDEAISGVNVAGTLQEEARGWALAWQRAMDEQNRRNRAGEVDAVKARRNWFEEQVVARVTGDESDGEVSHPPAAAMPIPPNFHPTCTEVRY